MIAAALVTLVALTALAALAGPGTIPGTIPGIVGMGVRLVRGGLLRLLIP